MVWASGRPGDDDQSTARHDDRGHLSSQVIRRFRTIPLCATSEGANMAEIATAKKTLDALRKAHQSGDVAKTASLLGTLKVRAVNDRRR